MLAPKKWEFHQFVNASKEVYYTVVSLVYEKSEKLNSVLNTINILSLQGLCAVVFFAKCTIFIDEVIKEHIVIESVR